MAPLFATTHAALLPISPGTASPAALLRAGRLRIRPAPRRRVIRAAASGKPDPTVDDDEWGSENPASEPSPVVADEWGEPGVAEPEQPSGADAPTNDDEWGGEPTPTPPTPVPATAAEGEDKDEGREDLKRCLVDTVYDSGLGLKASSEVRGEVVELVAQLEAANPTPAPVQAPDLDGNWILL